MNFGNQLKNLCEKAENEIILVAPFIKNSIFKELLKLTNPEIKITCVTRWRIEEILMGVSDIEIWEIIKSFPYASLWLRNNLHAKYYRVDKQCLIGSANLTANALNWSKKPNFELMISVNSDDDELKNFEHQLFNNCIKVDQVLFNLYQSAIVEQKELLSLKLDSNNMFGLNKNTDQNIIKNWLPTLRNPEDLYFAYTNEYDRLTNIACQNAIIDLSVFELPKSLSKTLFNLYIGIQLLEKPIIQEIDDFITIPRRFGEVCDYLNKIKGEEIDYINIKIQWQTLMRWFLYFLPSRYGLSVPNYSEIFYKYQ
ncbi:phospholipase D family protein [Geminocystis sp. NIES-3709]|uniref:phospholipase D family protein n=1 Tax=Geminocystis sp. NIES-3709 TaxID=1617448 RepID=UPI0005FCD8AD|nr:phospholipase D family protein [Geminocystis sp. NIES-3709]BAQ67034.1 hypothetical protein GM3709_3799 [Geminocystis sp. NIES-3709]